jgi:hypothetical protein
MEMGKSRQTLARLDLLDAMLRKDGVDVDAVAAQWEVQPARVREYLSYLKFRVGKIESIPQTDSKPRLYRYSDSVVSQ